MSMYGKNHYNIVISLQLIIIKKRNQFLGDFPERSVGLCCAKSVMSNSLQPRGLQPARLLCPWDSPGKNTEVGCYALLQGIFPVQGLNPHLLHLLHWQAGSLPLAPGEEFMLPLQEAWVGSLVEELRSLLAVQCRQQTN